MPKPTSLIVGGGHVGKPLAGMGCLLNYQVILADVRPECGQTFDAAIINENTYVVIMTEDAISDESVLRQTLGTPACYIGMIGSPRKYSFVQERLRAEGVTKEQLMRLHAPIGLKLGGRQPAEVALAILAEIEMVQQHGSAESKSMFGALADHP